MVCSSNLFLESMAELRGTGESYKVSLSVKGQRDLLLPYSFGTQLTSLLDDVLRVT